MSSEKDSAPSNEGDAQPSATAPRRSARTLARDKGCTMVGVPMPQEALEALDRVARREMRSRSAQALYIILRFLETESVPSGPKSHE